MIEGAIISAGTTGDVFASNDDLQLKLGVGKVYSFANNDFNRLFNGAIYYTEGTLAPTVSPTTLPSVAPSGLPTQSRHPSSSPTETMAPTNNFLNLPTTLSGDQSNYGHMFEIASLTDIVIQAFDVHTASTTMQKMEIYNRIGSLGAFRSPAAWTKISKADLEIVGKGKYICSVTVKRVWRAMKNHTTSALNSDLVTLNIFIIATIALNRDRKPKQYP